MPSRTSANSAAPISPQRRGLLAKVHIARKQLAMQEQDYRALLQRIGGHESAADCSDDALARVLAEFRRMGWSDRPARQSDKPYVRLIYALWGQMKPFLNDPSRDALRSFVRRQTGVGAPEWLDSQRANKVTEGLKKWLAREQAKGKSA